MYAGDACDRAVTCSVLPAVPLLSHLRVHAHSTGTCVFQEAEELPVVPISYGERCPLLQGPESPSAGCVKARAIPESGGVCGSAQRERGFPS